MGFMGISDWVESDEAANLHYAISEEFGKLFEKEMKNEANCYNTPGWLNILLILKAYPGFIDFIDDKTIDQINARITKDTNENGYLWLKGGKALVKNFTKLCKERED